MAGMMVGRVLLGLTLALLLTQQVAAQDGTPASGAQCEEIEPRDASFFSGLAEAEAGADQDVASPEPGGEISLPEGEPADEDTIEEISRTYEILVSCLNAGDYLRIYALYTDDYLVRNLDEEALARLDATPAPVDAPTQSDFGGVLDTRQLDDDSVVALVSVSNAQSGEVLIMSTLVRGDSGWLITEEAVVEMEAPESQDEPAEATPAS